MEWYWSMGKVTLQRDGPIARITLSNPTRYNAMSLSMWHELAQCLRAADADAQVRVILLRGDGDKAFVSGADISEFESQRASEDGVAQYDLAVSTAQGLLSDCGKPVVTCIHGICYGGGLGLALACDLRYCAKTARFRMPAARLGLGYAYKSTKRMADVLGIARAAELFYTARVVDGVQAERIGLVHSAHDDVDAHVGEVLGMIAENAPLTLKAAKLALRASVANLTEQQLGMVDAAVRACFASEDYIEGRRAFSDKRAPRFTGR
jgi:enoyl-CoA hydratase/carnithine racemase